MSSLSITTTTLTNLYRNKNQTIHNSKLPIKTVSIPSDFNISRRRKCLSFSSNPQLNQQTGGEDEDEEEETLVEALRVPNQWLLPSKALEESEWLRVTLHKWLDDEYCPEDTNVEISKLAAESYYESLLEKQTDLGEILLRMCRKLESISYQESFHGPFSSANAAVSLIVQKIQQP